MFGSNWRTSKLLIIIVLLFTSFIFNIWNLNMFSQMIAREESFASKRYVIETIGCQIPNLDLNDVAIMSLLSKRPSYRCARKTPLIYSNLTSLTVNSRILKSYGIYDIRKLRCNFRPFWRVNPKGNESDDKINYGKAQHFNLSVNVKEEFVKVWCKFNNKTYEDFHSFVPMKGSKMNSKRNANDEKLNIIMIGIDSLSRLQFHRLMPETSNFLLQDLKAFEFMGYNKMADNTFPNLMAIFTGYNKTELVEDCWPTKKSKFDNCSFVWQNYTKTGYITSFAEEETSYSIFGYGRGGLYEQPTDYYWNTFDNVAIAKIGYKLRKGNVNMRCMGNRAMYKVLLDYEEKFIKTMKDNRFFNFYWTTTLTHDNNVFPSYADRDYMQHLIFLNQSGILNNSFLIFFSDHGYRFGKVRETHQGYLEERLPYVFFVLPSWFRQKYPIAMNNLRINSFRLTTPFDLHATLNHILRPWELSDDKLLGKMRPSGRGISMFLPIPENRTCVSADIPSHWCACKKSYPISKDDPVVKKAVQFTVEHINKLLKGFSRCVPLTLLEITYAGLAKYGDIKHIIRDYTLAFRTMPGHGLFDVTIRCTSCKSRDFQISGTISRLNIYGQQSSCIDDTTLKLYCYCKKQ